VQGGDALGDGAKYIYPQYKQTFAPLVLYLPLTTGQPAAHAYILIGLISILYTLINILFGQIIMTVGPFRPCPALFKNKLSNRFFNK